MKQDLIRGMIKKEIKSSLKEATTRSQVDVSLDRIEKMAGVKMLKKALGTGSVMQQASGLLSVVQAISGENPQVGKALARMLMKKGLGDSTSATPTTENKGLTSRMAKLDTTQQMKMLKNALRTKPATDQTNFVLDLLKGLDLKDAAKNRLFLKMRKELK